MLFYYRNNVIRLTLATILCASQMASTLAQAPIVESLSRNGRLLAANLVPGTTATIEWAPSLNGPWTNNWAGLDAVTVDSQGKVLVSVPMFYRVRGFGLPIPPPNMVSIPSGSFTIGDSFSEGGPDELPLHTVQLGAFFMDRYEVTKALWDEVYYWAVTNGYGFDHADSGQGKAPSHPAHSMTWYDAVKWCNARSEKEGRVPAYYTNAALTGVYRTGQFNLQNDSVKWTNGYRLPTEAEWDRAARGGVAGQRFGFGNTVTHGQANYYSSASYAYDLSPTRGYHPAYSGGVFPYTSPVGSFATNGYGLYDMVGNVWEMCWDWYDSTYYGLSPVTNPRGPASGSDRVLRGGGWNSIASHCRSASRFNRNTPAYRNNLHGFRTVLPSGQP